MICQTVVKCGVENKGNRSWMLLLKMECMTDARGTLRLGKEARHEDSREIKDCLLKFLQWGKVLC